jgi:hypothetical protein
MAKEHVVRLTEGERALLQRRISAGSAPVHVQTHARVLLKADEGPVGPGWTDRAMAVAREREVAAWEAERNSLSGTIDWRFATEDARFKLKRLYPSIDV